MPAELHDKYWTALGEAGELDTTARIVLGPGELVLGADAGLVVSYAVIRDADGGIVRPVVGPNGVTIVVRELRTGAIQRTLDVPMVPAYSILVGERLFWWGRSTDEDGPDPDRGAVWGIDLANADSEPKQITPSVREQFGPGRTRSFFWVTDGRRAVLSGVGNVTEQATQVIDVVSMTVRMTVDGESVYELVGHVALVLRAENRIGLFDVATNQPIGPPLEFFILQRTFAGDDEVFVQYGIDGEGVYVGSIDLESGESRILLHQPHGVLTSYLTDMSTPTVLVLLNGDWDFGSDGLAAARVSLLDPPTGQLKPDAFVIGSPK